jgi:hypothetical protein
MNTELNDEQNKAMLPFVHKVGSYADFPKMYGCSYDGCDATFATLANKKRHEKTHAGDRPYACDYGCGKAFSRKYDMKVHLRVHTKEKPYSCSVESCSKRFSRNSSLREHERSIHHLNQARRRSCSSSDESDSSPAHLFSLSGNSYSNPSLIKRDHSDNNGEFAPPRHSSLEITDPITKSQIATLVHKYQEAKRGSGSFSIDEVLSPIKSELPDPPGLAWANEQTHEETTWALPITNQIIL